MKSFGTVVLSVALVAMIAACSKDKPTAPLENSTYPLKIGNRWDYDVKIEYHNFRSDNPDIHLPNVITEHEKSTVEIVGTEDVSGVGMAFHVRELYEFADNNMWQGDMYLVNMDDGMYMVAGEGRFYASPLGANKGETPKRPRLNRLHRQGTLLPVHSPLIHGSQAANVIGDSPPDNAWVCLKYPLTIGDEWEFASWADDEDDSIIITEYKKVMGTENVHCGVGNYKCFKIERSRTVYEEDEYFDFIGSVGLTCRLMYLKDFTATEDDLKYSYDVNVTYTLENADLK